MPANITDSTNNTLISPALVAMQARKQLQQKHVELNQHEKKKRKSITVNSTSSPTEITTNTQHQSLDLQERLMNLAHSTAKVTSQPSENRRRMITHRRYRRDRSWVMRLVLEKRR
ncbi:hypothetical protein [[Haemophilus] ducreyi]|uniref:hypothetical protein n=1 Tax=Haemophilus ducreyi TaxID=730 RepID=UPI00065605F4|nr:hypothetical protein [[Haemophilus] ducreyi]AKO31566.1 hypothetical protein RY60_07910 [[Haemophilus] ducreyi]